MAKVQVTYDGQQHATSREEGREAALDKRVQTDCPYTGKGEELSPMELLGTSLAGCMLISMGTLALRDENLDLTGTSVDVDVETTEGGVMRIKGIDLTFHMPRNFEPRDRKRLERAAEACPIKHSFHPDTALSVRYLYPDTQS